MPERAWGIKMGKVRKIINAPEFIAAGCTLVLLLLFLFTSPMLSLAGDVNISEYLSSSKVKAGFFFYIASFSRILESAESYLLCKLVEYFFCQSNVCRTVSIYLVFE